MYLRSAATNARTAPTRGAFLTYVNCAIQEYRLLKHAPVKHRCDAVQDIVELMDVCHEKIERGLETQLADLYRSIVQKTSQRSPHTVIETNARLQVHYFDNSRAA